MNTYEVTLTYRDAPTFSTWVQAASSLAAYAEARKVAEANGWNEKPRRVQAKPVTTGGNA